MTFALFWRSYAILGVVPTLHDIDREGDLIAVAAL